jgi:nicotinamidase/pyrazinamidase
MSKIIIISKTDAHITIDGENDFMDEKGTLFVQGIEGELPSNEDAAERIVQIHQLPFGYRAGTLDRHTSDTHIEYERFGRHCVEGTWGAEIHPSLVKVYQNLDLVLSKGTDPNVISFAVSTSPMFLYHIGEMRRKKIERVFVDGFAFTHCVGESAIVYADQGFETYIVRDATRSVAPPYGDPERMDKRLEFAGVKTTYSSQLKPS